MNRLSLRKGQGSCPRFKGKIFRVVTLRPTLAKREINMCGCQERSRPNKGTGAYLVIGKSVSNR